VIDELVERKDAQISECGRYRYSLIRQWGYGPFMTFIMLNPSTADSFADDPTIRRCRAFAKRESMSGLLVVNLYAFRATNPADLPVDFDDRVGPFNGASLVGAISGVAARGGHMVAAWGSSVGNDLRMVHRVSEWATDQNVPLHCLGTTKDGHPRHPLYVKGDTPLEEWK